MVLAILVDLFDGSFSKIGLDLIIYLQDNIQLGLLQRSPGITILTAAAFTFAEVANKLLFYYLIADQYIVNDYHVANLRKNRKRQVYLL